MKTPFAAAFLLGAAGLAAAVATGPPAELQSEDLDSNYHANYTMAIESREEKEAAWHGLGKAVCGVYANADWLRIMDFAWDMDNTNYNTEWTIGGGQCNRVKCWDTSAFYVCNDNKNSITLKGKQIGMATKYVRQHCCYAGPRSKTEHNFVSGQQFTPWGWNVNIGYGNCNDPPEIRPHMAGGWGVNKGTCPYVVKAEVGF